ncbi:MAG: ubiquinol-cytochrome c reductase iron-sulfur subunit [bacterium]
MSLNEIDEAIPRRGFLKIAIAVFNGLIALALAIPGLGYLLTPIFRKGAQTWVRLGSLGKFRSPEPQKALFSYSSQSDYTTREKKALVWVRVNPDDREDVSVLSAVCTHMGCNVAWHPEVEKFICPCHGGTYDIDGEVISGPPPRPLAKLPFRIENDQILVHLQDQ